jgi:hypothetical protein
MQAKWQSAIGRCRKMWQSSLGIFSQIWLQTIYKHKHFFFVILSGIFLVQNIEIKREYSGKILQFFFLNYTKFREFFL